MSTDASARQSVLDWEKRTRPIAIRPELVRITGSVDGAYLLSQILYWFGTDETGQTRARVERDGEVWIAKTPDDWAMELGYMTESGEPRPKIIRRVIHNLKAAGLVETEIFRFDGLTTTHVRPCWDALNAALPGLPKRAKRIAPNGQSALPQTGQSALPQTGQSALPQTGQSALPTAGKASKETETTTKTTAETTRVSSALDRGAIDVPPVRAAARTTRLAPTEVSGEGVSEPNDAPTTKPSKHSWHSGPTRRRQSAVPKPQAPEGREGPFREVFRSICRVRRQSPDILAKEDRANTRRLAGTLCRAGVENADTVESWGRGWYADMARRTNRPASQVGAPTIAQLTTWFGGMIAERDGGHMAIETAETTTGGKRWMTN